MTASEGPARREGLGAVRGSPSELDFRVVFESAPVSQLLLDPELVIVAVSDAYDISRIETGQLLLSLEAVPVADVVADALDLVRPLASARSVHLAPAPARPASQHVLADHQRLRQVLLNLLSNAVKYNRPAGAVTTAVRLVPGGRLRISVTDTGIEGTELGLALSRHLVQVMGGATGVTSTLGVGSTFWVELPTTEPVAVAPHAVEPDAVVTSRTYAGTKTLLYVEDMIENVRLVEQIRKRRPSIRDLLQTVDDLLQTVDDVLGESCLAPGPLVAR